jgi:hypothetical protein
VLQIINRTPAMIADLTFNKWPAFCKLSKQT